LLEDFLRVVTEASLQAGWLLEFCAVVVAAFVIYIGVTLVAALIAPDEYKYKILVALLGLFRRSGRR